MVPARGAPGLRGWRDRSAPPSRARAAQAALALLSVVAAGCAGPRQGCFGEMRGRTELLAEAEERAPPPLPGQSGSTQAFPLYFREATAEREVLEALWPVFERGRS